MTGPRITGTGKTRDYETQGLAPTGVRDAQRSTRTAPVTRNHVGCRSGPPTRPGVRAAPVSADGTRCDQGDR